jgi:hypothetical protein
MEYKKESTKIFSVMAQHHSTIQGERETDYQHTTFSVDKNDIM